MTSPRVFGTRSSRCWPRGGRIETRLTTEPERYGAALRGTLRGHRKLRVGDYRVVFKVTANEVLVLAVMHRRRVYEDVEERVD